VSSAIIIVLGVLVFIAEVSGAATTELAPYPWFENLIPATLFIAVGGLALAWRWERLGGALTVIALLINFGLYLLTDRRAVGVVALILTPILIPAILFLLCWQRDQRLRLTHSSS